MKYPMAGGSGIYLCDSQKCDELPNMRMPLLILQSP